MTTPPILPPLRDVIAAFDLQAIKGLGQHFLLDLNLTDKIARGAGDLTQNTVLEIGPGPGGLSRALLAQGARNVIAIEKDRRCIAALAPLSTAYPGRFTVHEKDALSLIETELQGLSHPVKIIANLPYRISTALLVKWLTVDPWPPWYEAMTLMFQKEVADRIVAQPGTKAYGRLSVLSQWRAQPTRLFDIPARAFTPPPKVDSSLVQITPHSVTNKPGLSSALQKLTAAAFGQRRKMLRSSLRSLECDPLPILQQTGIDPTCRAEQISVSDFTALAEAYQNAANLIP